MSVSADTITTMVASNHGGKLSFHPACLVLLVEITKFAFSAILRVISLCMQKSTAEAEAAKLESVVKSGPQSWVQVFSYGAAIALPAGIYAASNILNYYGIARSKTSQYAIFRETGLLWNACLWCVVFNMAISKRRWLAIFGIFLGCSIKAVPDIVSGETSLVDLGVIAIMIQSFLSALGGVSNEYVLKKDPNADINTQNAIMYFFGAGFALLTILAVHPSRLQSKAAFFDGFEPSCWRIVILQSLVGLSASRILKHANAVTKGVITALRGPALMVMSAMMLRSLPSWQGFTVWDLASALVICPATMLYLLSSSSSSKPASEPSKSKLLSAGEQSIAS
jgi:drug/metabolite transporter (DMT)-like permease